jgi:outer membrane beta-barrel protein
MTTTTMTIPISPSRFFCGLLALFLLPAAVQAETTPPLPQTDQVILPEVDRRDIRIPRIRARDFEVGAFAGMLSVEDFGAKPLYGARLAYHVSEDFFVEGLYGKSTVSDEALCNVGLCLFPNRDEDLSYYALSVGYNLFPGELFFGKNTAFNTTIYLLAGVGSTSFVDESHFTLNLGFGFRVVPRDWLALHITIRDYLYESDFLGTNKLTNNIEFSLGASYIF